MCRAVDEGDAVNPPGVVLPENSVDTVLPKFGCELLAVAASAPGTVDLAACAVECFGMLPKPLFRGVEFFFQRLPSEKIAQPGRFDRRSRALPVVIEHVVNEPPIRSALHVASDLFGCDAIAFEQRVELREGLESVLLLERHHDVTQLMLQIAPTVIDPAQFFRFCLHAAVFGHMQTVLVFQLSANRHGAPQFVVVVDLPALLVHPHRDDVHVSPCDVFVQKDDVGLATVSHAFHELGGKSRELRFRKPVFGRGVEREMHDRFSDTGIERRVVPESFRTLLDTEPAVAAFGYSLHV